MPRKLLPLVVAAVLLLCGEAQATTYYVDSNGGNNANPGLSMSEAWQTPPGLGTSGRGWPSGGLVAGDRVIIKRGSSFTGLWSFSSWYQARGATRQNPIAVEVADNWGTGPVTLRGCINIVSEGIRLDGKTGDLSGDSPVNYGLVLNTDVGQAGGQIDKAMRIGGREQSLNHVLVNGSSGCGGGIVAFWGVRDSEANYLFVDGQNSGNHVWGISLGNTGSDKSCTNVTLNHCYVCRLGGPGSYMGGGDDYWIGIHSLDNGPLYLNDCQVFDTGGRCFDFGGYNSVFGTAVFNRCVARGGHASGFGVNGEEVQSPVPAAYFNYCVARNNADYGFKIYQVNGDTYLNNCVLAGNGSGIACYGGEGDKGWVRPTRVHVFNSAFYKNGRDWEFIQIREQYQNLEVEADYNAYWGSGALTAAYSPGPGTLYYQGAGIGQANGAWGTFSNQHLKHTCDAHSLSEVTAGFNAGTANADGGDFRLQSGSSLIDRGTEPLWGPNGAPARDYYQDSAPVGRRDIGVYEAGGVQLEPIDTATGESSTGGGSASTPSAGTSGSGGGGGCFIATAAYGSPMASQVGVLRKFRDTWLSQVAPGRAFVQSYYRLGPAAASYVGPRDGLRAAVRLSLQPLLWACGLLSLGLTGALSLAGVAALLLLAAWREWRPAAQGCASREM